MASGKRSRALRRELGARQLRRASDVPGTGSTWTPLEVVETRPDGEIFRNRLYQVTRLALDPSGTRALRAEDPEEALWLVITRLDGKATRDWRHFQRIKNEVAGPEREAFEIFPAESRLVDTGNAYHLWVLAADERLPYGPTRRSVSGPRPGVRQRAFDA